jgi:hypothetical protein
MASPANETGILREIDTARLGLAIRPRLGQGARFLSRRGTQFVAPGLQFSPQAGNGNGVVTMSNRKMPRALAAIPARIGKRFAGRRAALWLLAWIALEIAGLVVAWSAWAGSANGARNTVCLGGRGSFACSTNWRYRDDFDGVPGKLKAADPDEETRARERERKWTERCHPVLRQDALGVSRYFYAAAGCEHGRVED